MLLCQGGHKENLNVKIVNGHITKQILIRSFLVVIDQAFNHQASQKECKLFMQTSLDVIPHRLSKQDRRCEQWLTLDELTIALMKMVKDKSPRLEGFMYKFYKAPWNFVEPNLLLVYKEAIRKAIIRCFHLPRSYRVHSKTC